jgi:lipoate-protein ligase A
MEAWLFLESPPGRAAFNMALDEALLQTAAARQRPLLRVYAWERPAVSFGYFQKFPAHLAGEYAIVRRPTGGGVVYHRDDTTYTVIAPPEHPLARLKTAAAYEQIHRAVAAALGAVALHKAPLVSPAGQYECFQKPVQGDVMAGGRKLAGGAQRRTKWGLLHQGSIAARVRAPELQAGFAAVLAAVFVDHALTPAELALADRLTAEKYATTAWNKRVG